MQNHAFLKERSVKLDIYLLKCRSSGNIFAEVVKIMYKDKCAKLDMCVLFLF